MANTDIEKKILKHKSGLYAFALSLTNDIEDANDLLQDTVLKILSNSDSYKEKGVFYSWACTLMHNIFVNSYKKRMGRSMILDDTFPLFIKSSDAPVDSSFTIEEITTILNKLPENLMRVFKMYLNGFSYNEISGRLKIPLGTVKTRIYTSRIRLKQIFKEFNK